MLRRHVPGVPLTHGPRTRDKLIHRWNETQQYHTTQDVKRVYYLSMEFLMGRSLDNAILNLDIKGKYRGGVLARARARS